MFERMTDRSRRVIVLSQEHARSLGHREISTAHFLLALISEEDGIAGRALSAAGVTFEDAEARANRVLGDGGPVQGGHIPFTERTKKVLEYALRESLQLGHRHIGTEHLLLGLLREGNGSGVRVLVEGGVTPAALRRLVIALVTAEAPAHEPITATEYPVSLATPSPADPAITQITVHVNDLGRSLEFYTAAGLEFAEPEHPLGLKCAGAMIAPGMCLFLVERMTAIEPSNGISFRLLVDTAGPAVTALEAHGASKGAEHPGGTWSFADPDGNILVLVPRYGLAA